MTDFEIIRKQRLAEFEAHLESCLDEKVKYHQTIIEAMRYSLLNGGKRIRALLVMGFYEALGGNYKDVFDTAAAMEMVHSYSLIHDDLPCMDNDDYRRGKLTNHKVYGEAMAVLAGDALLTMAFQQLSENRAKFSDEAVAKSVLCLSSKAGYNGMVGGQVIDIENEGKRIDAEMLHDLHSRKTGALIKAACELGVIMAGGDEKAAKTALEYGENIGVAFQIQDDILDVIGNAQLLGKATGHDAETGKTTYVTLYGVEESKKMAENYFDRAYAALEKFEGNTEFLKGITDFLISRKW